MPIQVPLPIRPIDPLNFALIEDKYLKGGFRSVETYADLDSLDVTALKVGMLVGVNDEDGKVYELVSLDITQDEWGDAIAIKTFSPFLAAGKLKNVYNRPSKTIVFSDMTFGIKVEKSIDMGCKSFILASLSIGNGRKMKLNIYNNSLKNEQLPFEFISNKKSFYDGTTYLKNKTKFQYKQYQVFINTNSSGNITLEDGTVTLNQNVFTFTCESLEDNVFYTSKGFSGITIPIEITYIPLEV